MAEAQGSDNIVDKEVTGGKDLTLENILANYKEIVLELTLDNILAIYNDAHNKATIHRVLIEYHDSLCGGDATSPEVRQVVKRALEMDTSTTDCRISIEDSIMNLRRLRGGINLPATMWNIFDKNGVQVKATDDSRIYEVKNFTKEYGVITFKFPVDWTTAVDILKNSCFVFMAFGNE